MTIEEVLHELQAYWGNEWPTAAMRRLLILGTITVLALTDDEIQEYRLLKDWALEMIEAGIASKGENNG